MNTDSIRGKARINLLVSTVNVISLDPGPFEPDCFEFEIAGLPAKACVADSGYDEIKIDVVVDPTELGRKFRCMPGNGYIRPKFGAVTSFAWLERRAGKYLQSGVNYHGARDVTQKLAALEVAPNGFDTKPCPGCYDFFDECERLFGRRRS